MSDCGQDRASRSGDATSRTERSTGDAQDDSRAASAGDGRGNVDDDPFGLSQWPAPTPRWHISLPAEPGAISAEYIAPPQLMPAVTSGAQQASDSDSDADSDGDAGEPALLLLSASTLGVVAVEAASGEVAWHYRELSAPGVPLVVDADTVWLSGRCFRDAETAPTSPGRVLGCIERVDRGGQVQSRSWLQRVAHEPNGDPDSEPGDDPPMGRRESRAVGQLGPYLAWADGVELLAVEPAPIDDSGEVSRAAQAVSSPSSSPLARVVSRYRPAATDSDGLGVIHGWLADGRLADGRLEVGRLEVDRLKDGQQVIIATNFAITGYDACEQGKPCPQRWSRAYPRATGFAGPVRAPARDAGTPAAGGDRDPAATELAWVRDQSFEIGAEGTPRWTAPGYYAHAPGSVAAYSDGSVGAWRVDGGVRPVRVTASADDFAIREGEPAPGIQVLAAAMWPTGAAAVVRLDTSLRRDAVVLWDRGAAIQWIWPLPRPTRPRAEAITMTALPALEDGSAPSLVVFYGGNTAARLPTAP
ncbi:MAG: hypothetical protein Tsb0020_43380 [Haliangiales bacterium]